MNHTKATGQNTHESELTQLMVKYQRADGDALAELVHRLTPAMLRFFQGPHETRLHTEDMVQEFWLRVHKSRHTFRPEDPLLPWIYSIARYTRVDMFRRLRHRHATASSQVELNEDQLQSERSEQAVLDSRLDSRKLLARLPEKQREVIELTKLKGMTVVEAACAIGTTVGAVKQRAFRAQRNLRSMARQMQQEGAPDFAKAA